MKKLFCFLILFFLFFSFGCIEEEKDNSIPQKIKPEEKIFVPEEFEYLDYADYNIFEMEKNIHILINDERRKLGLTELEFDEHLAFIARKYSKDMAENDFFSHFDLQGKDFGYRYEQAGYNCEIKVGNLIHLGAENLFKYNIANSVYSDGKIAEFNSQEQLEAETVKGWMNSPKHKENIEKEFWLNEGIGVYINEKGDVLVTQNFC